MSRLREILIKTAFPCPKTTLELLQDNFHQLDLKSLEMAVRDRFYDPDVMKAVQCALSSLLKKPDSSSSLALNERITSLIKDLKPIGDISSNGSAFVGSLKTTNDLFVLKTPVYGDTSLIHELVVGIFGTNPLREKIPNFAYVYCGFKCSPPVYDETSIKRDIVNWCDTNFSPVDYILYENITPSIPFEKYVLSCSVEQFLNCYVQILYSLRTAFLENGFTHYDLHNGNVLVRTVSEKKFQIPYNTENGLEYVVAENIATFIDYGMSHFKTTPFKGPDGILYPSRHLGEPNLEKYQVYADRSWVIGDLYKLLLFTARDTQRTNNCIFQACAKLYRFFYTDSIERGLERGRHIFYTFPYLEGNQLALLDSFATYIRGNFECPFITTSKEFKILSCESLKCDTEEDLYTDWKLSFENDFLVPKSILEFNMLSETRQKELLHRFDYKAQVQSAVLQLKILGSEISEKVSALTLDDLERVEDLYKTLEQIYSEMNKFIILTKSCFSVAALYSDVKTKRKLNNILSKLFRTVDPKLSETTKVLQKHIKGLTQQKVLFGSLAKYETFKQTFAVVSGRKRGREKQQVTQLPPQ